MDFFNLRDNRKYDLEKRQAFNDFLKEAKSQIRLKHPLGFNSLDPFHFIFLEWLGKTQIKVYFWQEKSGASYNEVTFIYDAPIIFLVDQISKFKYEEDQNKVFDYISFL